MAKKNESFVYFRRRRWTEKGRNSLTIAGMKPRHVVTVIDAEIYEARDSREVEALRKDDEFEEVSCDEITDMAKKNDSVFE